MELNYNLQGLIPAIVQDAASKQVLMLAYMNEESLQKTLATRTTWFYSRSRQELWNKGATSGNIQHVNSVAYDCDGDTLLIQVTPEGPACHTGAQTCFYQDLIPNDAVLEQQNDIVQELVSTIRDRKTSPVEGSYTNYLLDKGIDKVLKKVGEEAAEVIIASKNVDKNELIYELSDLVYHSLVLMEIQNVTLDEIRKELERRHRK